MKKNLLLIPVAALAFAACSNETTEYVGDTPQVQLSKEVAFNVFAQPVTRAASDANVYNAVGEGVTDAAKYPKNYTMDVACYMVPKQADGTTDNTTTRKDYFDKTNYSFNYAGGSSGATHGYWGATTTPKYWPLFPATLNFLAVSNGGPATGVTITTTFGSGSNYASALSTVMEGTNGNQPATVDAKGAQHDLMYAYGRGSVTQVGNNFTFNNANGYVDMTFLHAQAWVMFRVKAATSTETAITVNSITLNNAYYGGTFQAGVDNYNIGTTALDWTASSRKWVAKTNQGATIQVPNYSATALTTDYANVGSGLMVVPTGSMDSPSPSFDSFTINYTYDGNTFDYTFTPTDAQKTLLMAKKYIFDITFKMHEIFVNASVNNWEDTPTNNVDVPTQSFAYVASTGETGTYTLPTATAGTYFVTITGLPSDKYKAQKGTGTGDFITAVSPSSYTESAVTTLNVSFTVNSDTGKNQTVEIYNDEGTPVKLFTLTVAQP